MSFFRPKKNMHLETVKNGRRTYGAIVTLENGKQVYLAYRKQSEIYRKGAASLSEAIDQGLACWAIDIDTLKMLKARGIKVVGVAVKDSHDIWLAHMRQWDNDSEVLNFSTRGGALQRYLNLKHFRFHPGKVTL